MLHNDDSERTPKNEQPTDSDSARCAGTPPDVSGGWRAEYAAQGVTPAGVRDADPGAEHPVPDGGAWVPDPGALVLDREDTDTPDDRPPEQLVVLDAGRSFRASEVLVPTLDAVTVAEVNPGYPADAPVATAVYVGEASAAGVALDDQDALDAAVADGVVYPYAFPTPRLRPAPDALADEGEVTAAW